MAENDIYEVNFVQSWGVDGFEIRNTQYYRQTLPGNPQGAAHLANLWLTVFPALFQAVQNEMIRYQYLEVKNIIPGPDYILSPFVPATTGGQVVGDVLPPQDCWAFRLNRNTTAIRNGAKRVAGVSENSQTEGTVEPGMVAALTALANAFAMTLNSGGGNTTQYKPKIFRPASEGYTIPEKIVPAKLQLVGDVASASFVGITTQNSRKLNKK